MFFKNKYTQKRSVSHFLKAKLQETLAMMILVKNMNKTTLILILFRLVVFLIKTHKQIFLLLLWIRGLYYNLHSEKLIKIMKSLSHILLKFYQGSSLVKNSCFQIFSWFNLENYVEIKFWKYLLQGLKLINRYFCLIGTFNIIIIPFVISVSN